VPATKRGLRPPTPTSAVCTDTDVDSKIIEFAGVLRRNGIRVSTAETLEALQAASVIGIEQRGAFKSALRATMVKRVPDLESFNSLFDLYFAGMSDLISELGAASAGEMTPQEFQELLERIEEMLDAMDPPPSELARALIMQDSGTLERLMRDMANSEAVKGQPSPTMTPAALRRMMDALGAAELAEELDRVSQAAEDSGFDEDAARQLKEYLEQRLKDFGKMLKGAVEIEGEQEDKKEEREKDRERLLDKSFYYLSPSEIRQMREAVSGLARKLKNLMAIRRKRAKRGRLDVKATLRNSMEFGGVPFRIRYEKKRKERPQVVILCDISDSVRNVSRFMLQFVHSLQDMYSRVRSYVFVAEIAEVSKLFADNDIQTAIHDAINGNVVNVYAHSDFGRAFKDFHADHIDVIDSRTTVIILGDARNNYNAAQEWVLRDIRERAKQVIWLNPENRSTWGFGDSEMSKYQIHCDTVEECRNLRQLYKVVDNLILT
jgi:uncharacterized protein with von Willebrand factor type A (vWA) domain